MRIHHLQHVPFEGLGSIEPHLLKLRHQLTSTHLYRSEPLPEIDAFDALIVMGGPKGVMDHADYPWLQAELDFYQSSDCYREKSARYLPWCATDRHRPRSERLSEQLARDRLVASDQSLRIRQF